ncbi:MAG: PepSY domain-containing protein [Paracoccaceae bacterium]
MKHFVFLMLIAFAVPAFADSNEGHGNGDAQDGQDHDHDRARDAVVRHDAQPLSAILPEIERRYEARMMAVKFEAEDGLLVYEIELITATGRIFEVVVDAASGNIVKDDTGHDDDGYLED